MLSNHYSFLYSHPHHWLILFIMMVAGALIRQFFVQRHAYHLGRASNPLPFAIAGVVVILSLVVWMRPAPPGAHAATAATAGATPTIAQVQAVIEQRCHQCHGAQVHMKNIRLDSVELIQQNAQPIYQQAVITRQMPMNNATGITDAERDLIKRWYEAL
jgi:uncharacterized membrane protein